MWIICFFLSIGCTLLAVISSLVISKSNLAGKRQFNFFNMLFAGVFLSAFFLFLPIHSGGWRGFWLSVFNAMQVFAMGGDYSAIKEGMFFCPDWLAAVYLLWVAMLFVLAPILTFGFVLSLFKNISANLKYLRAYFRDAYVFSELNDKSLTLARDMKRKNPKAVIIFTNVDELTSKAWAIGAICFKKDILAVNFHKHSPKSAMFFFMIGSDETENLNQSLQLIQNEKYKTRENTRLYVFSTRVESELVLTSIDKGKMKVRRVNEVQSLINRLLYDRGKIIFESAKEAKRISAVVVGMGRHGTEMVKSLAWYGQMDGYSLEINAFDKDPLAEEKFASLAPDLLSPAYNGVIVEGEAQYKITIHSGIDVESISFANEIKKIANATYVIVALGNDALNINTAVNLRMRFERMGIHPVIQAIVYNSQQKKALVGIKNYSGQEYDIEFIGDIESSYTEDVIVDSEVEKEALARHLKWGIEEDFWTYEYNYRSSMASAIHMKARMECGIPGAAQKEEELTDQERDTIEVLEHRRWNAYMRSEGYVYSKKRNNLAKTHHDLVDFSSLTEEEKRKDSQVGTK